MCIRDSPTTCPHGNPIPGTDYQPPASVTLDTLLVGQSFTVSRIPEELEFTPGLLEFLETSSLLPGHSGVITELVAGGITIVEIDGQTVEITRFATQRILVTAA